MVVNIDPRTDPLWQKLVEQHESGVFNSPSWARALTETYNWKAEAYVIQDGAGNPQAGISFCRIEDLFGRRIVSLPFSDYCDPLVNDVEHWRVLIEELMVEQCPIVVRCLHNNLPLADERFAVTKQAKWHGIDLQ